MEAGAVGEGLGQERTPAGTVAPTFAPIGGQNGTVSFNDRPPRTIVVVAPVRDIGHGGGVVVEGAIPEFGDDRLVFVIKAAKHEEEFDGGTEGSFLFVEMDEVFAEI